MRKRKRGWLDTGKVHLQFELLPQRIADADRRCGQGREEPNRFPKLPEPDRERLSLFSPWRCVFSLAIMMLGSTVALRDTHAMHELCCCLGLCCVQKTYLKSNLWRVDFAHGCACEAR